MIDFSENTLVEQPAIVLLAELGWETANCFREFDQVDGSPLRRKTRAEVVLVSRSRPVLPLAGETKKIVTV